jgi:hypothetical protein
MDFVVQLALETRELAAPVVNLIAALVSRPVAPPEAFITNFDTREGTWSDPKGTRRPE